MAAFGGGFGAAAATANHNPNKDVELTSPPDDSVSSLSFSPTANHLVATSWDNKVRSHHHLTKPTACTHS
jgi:mRNA export factor